MAWFAAGTSGLPPWCMHRSRFAASLGLFLLVGLVLWQAATSRWHCDDAYISFRYVWNLVHGNGLVFNAGDRVEGYTNFLWVLELAAIERVLGVPPEVACDGLSLAFTALSLACVIAFAWGGPKPARRALVAGGALCLLATSRTWIVWSTSGLETRQFTFLLLTGILFATRARGRTPAFVLASLAFGCAELTRPEATLAFGCTILWLGFDGWMARRPTGKTLLAFCAPFVLIVTAHYLWRHAYYGEWLPNTYYAKYVRAWPEAGWRYLTVAAIEGGAWFTLPFALVGCLGRARRGDRTHVLSLLLLAAHGAYVLDVGGDVFEWRPLDFHWPLIAVPAVEGMCALADRVGAGKPSRLALGRACGALALVAALVFGSAIQCAKVRAAEHDTESRLAQDPIRPLDRAAVPFVFGLPPLCWLADAHDRFSRYLLAHRVAKGWSEHVRDWERVRRAWGPLIGPRDVACWPPDAATAQAAIGVVGYGLPGLRMIDLHGLTDRELAHRAIDVPNESRLMAHERFMNREEMLARGWNLHPFPPTDSLVTALCVAPFAVRVREGVWLPFASPVPDWVECAFRGRNAWTVRPVSQIGCFDASRASDWELPDGVFALTDDVPHSRVFPWPARCDNRMGLSSRCTDGGGRGRGVARSPVFVLPPRAILEARACGSADGTVGLRVRSADSEVVLAEVRSLDPDWPLPMHVDLGAWAGSRVIVEAFDESDEAWLTLAGVVLCTCAELSSR